MPQPSLDLPKLLQEDPHDKVLQV